MAVTPCPTVAARNHRERVHHDVHVTMPMGAGMVMATGASSARSPAGVRKVGSWWDPDGSVVAMVIAARLLRDGDGSVAAMLAGGGG